MVTRAVLAACFPFLACGSLMGGWGCGGSGASGGAKGPTGKGHDGVQRFYPLDVGMQWSFLVKEPGEKDGLLSVTKVIAFDGKTAVLSQGSETLSLRVADDGLVREPSHAYVLRWPVKLSDKWAGAEGSTVEVTKVDVKVMVEAGEFEGCVETTERFGGDKARVVKTTFCPEVGPTVLEVRSLAVVPGEVPPSIVARLRAFGPPIELGAPGLKATPPGGK